MHKCHPYSPGLNNAGLRLFATSIIRGDSQIGEPRLRGVSVSDRMGITVRCADVVFMRVFGIMLVGLCQVRHCSRDASGDVTSHYSVSKCESQRCSP